jgi:GDP-fucose protein O-fucosyltransferase
LIGWLAGRKLVQYDELWQDSKLIHWRAKECRLLTHFYTFIRHNDQAVDNYHKRLIRDIMHYKDEMFCKASQIITMLKAESSNGSFSSFHIRRGDFQFAKTQQTAEDIMASAAEYLQPGEVVYIATDERDKRFFAPFHTQYTVRFLDDYFERAGLSELSNKNYIGMVDSIVASHGRTFTGTWWSTFSSYILRMRGYLGHTATSNWYFYAPKRKMPHKKQYPIAPFWMTGKLFYTI